MIGVIRNSRTQPFPGSSKQRDEHDVNHGECMGLVTFWVTRFHQPVEYPSRYRMKSRYRMEYVGRCLVQNQPGANALC